MATVLAVACGLVAFVDFAIPNPLLDTAGSVLAEGVTILAAFALLLGILNLLRNHASRVVAGGSGRFASVFLILGLLCTFVLAVLWPGSLALRWVFDHVYYPLQSTTAALLAFFVVSAAYRAFRLRNLEAAILLGSSLVILVTQLPFSGSISPVLPRIREWMMAVPVTAAMRGMILGIALGTMSTSLRILLAVDRPYVGE
jgi:hypothetical protein